jgi:isopenicillin-N epimerase
MSQIRDLFQLNPDVIYLNHGSFGATPKPVMEAYQNWQREIEYQPVQFFVSDLFTHLESARQVLANYLHTKPDLIVYIPNATVGVNIVSRSLHLEKGDEVLISDHEYGACEFAWEYACNRNGAKLVCQPIPLPIYSQEEIIEHLWKGVSTRTKLIFLSHITSPTAIRFPVESICRRARDNGIYTFIDGAHAPGHITLNLDEIGADFYTGNCHKWMLAPKGSGFLHVQPEAQELIDPLIISWGWGGNPDYSSGSRFIDNLQWWGTHDPSAFLTVPSAIGFQEKYNWRQEGETCHSLAIDTRKEIGYLTGLDQICPDSGEWINQMFINRLPSDIDPLALKLKLYNQFQIEVPIIVWNECNFIRISIQAYNSLDDIDALLNALEHLL